MKYSYIASAFLLLFSLLFPSCGNAPVERTAAEEQSVADTVSALPPMDSLRCVEGKVKSGQFFSTLMTEIGRAHV